MIYNADVFRRNLKCILFKMPKVHDAVSTLLKI